jgi:DNA-3-methyladenine glycosylase I
LRSDEDGSVRCWWGHAPSDYCRYHDEEWGRPVVDDFKLFEKICLESFQSGLSWLIILRKRDNFRAVFAVFDFYIIAEFDNDRVAELLQRPKNFADDVITSNFSVLKEFMDQLPGIFRRSMLISARKT